MYVTRCRALMYATLYTRALGSYAHMRIYTKCSAHMRAPPTCAHLPQHILGPVFVGHGVCQ